MFRTDSAYFVQSPFTKVFALESYKCKNVNKMETVENVTLKELNCIVVWWITIKLYVMCLDQINHSTLITCTVTTNVSL